MGATSGAAQPVDPRCSTECGLCSVLESPAVVSGLDNIAVVREPIKKSRGHLRVTEDRRPLAEGEVGGDDDGGHLVKPTDEMEEKLAA